VVPPHIPYSISGNTIYGRGSNDAKGSVATQIQAVEELRKAGKVSDGDVAMLFVVGEEVFPTPAHFISSFSYLFLCLGC
jgi:acetylornithine deacetylase